jgi:hypothetical protein
LPSGADKLLTLIAAGRCCNEAELMVAPSMFHLQVMTRVLLPISKCVPTAETNDQLQRNASVKRHDAIDTGFNRPSRQSAALDMQWQRQVD